jgi:hypothetical protein
MQQWGCGRLDLREQRRELESRGDREATMLPPLHTAIFAAISEAEIVSIA